ncbi:hypothetical protein ACROYT_G026968 [Oculina patagonica]
MSTNGHFGCLLHLKTLLAIIQATLALLSSSFQGNQAATITVSPSSSVLPSSTIQRNFTTNSWSLNETTMNSLRTTAIVSSVMTSSSSSAAQSLVHSTYTYTKTWTHSSGATMSPTTSIKAVSQSNYTTAPALPTTKLIIKGLPSVKVVAAIAGVLGAILVMLLAIIVWYLCIAEVLPVRRSSRVAPSDVTESVSDVL